MGMGGMEMARWLPHWRCMHAYGCVRACLDDGAAVGVEEVRAAAGLGAGEDEEALGNGNEEGAVECILFSCAVACARTLRCDDDARGGTPWHEYGA